MGDLAPDVLHILGGAFGMAAFAGLVSWLAWWKLRDRR